MTRIKRGMREYDASAGSERAATATVSRRTRGRWLVLGMIGVVALVVTAAVFWLRPHGTLVWSAGASRPLVDEWGSYTEAGRAGEKITSSSRPQRIRQVTIAGRRAYRVEVLPR